MIQLKHSTSMLAAVTFLVADTYKDITYNDPKHNQNPSVQRTNEGLPTSLIWKY